MPNNTPWKWATISYIIALHLFVVVLIVKTVFIPKLTAKLGVAPTPHRVAAIPDSHILKMVQFHQWMDASVPDKATIFLGDSITQGLATAAVTPYSINYGIGGETTARLLDAMPMYKSLARASAIFMNIGINDLNQGMKVGLNDRYRKIIKALPPKTPLLWSAIMPAHHGNIVWSDIIDANLTIKTLCAKRGNRVYVDTWKFLTDKDGQMINRLFLDDGMHLRPEGYRAWITALKQAIQDIPLADAQPVIPPGAAQ